MMRPPAPPGSKSGGGAGAPPPPAPPRLQSLCVVMTGFFFYCTDKLLWPILPYYICLRFHPTLPRGANRIVQLYIMVLPDWCHHKHSPDNKRLVRYLRYLRLCLHVARRQSNKNA